MWRNGRRYNSLVMALLLLGVTFFAMQNCSDMFSNGDGYWGLRLKAPLTARAGETVDVEVVGGEGPYKVLVVSGRAQVTEQSGNIIKLSFPADLEQDQNVIIAVEDQNGLKGMAQIYVVKLLSGTSNSLGDVKYFASQVQLLEKEAFVGFPFYDGVSPEGRILYFQKVGDWNWQFASNIVPEGLSGAEGFFFASTFSSNSIHLAGVSKDYGGDLIVLSKATDGRSFTGPQRLQLPANLELHLGSQIQFHKNRIVVNVTKGVVPPYAPAGFAVFSWNELLGAYAYSAVTRMDIAAVNGVLKFTANEDELFVGGDKKVSVFVYTSQGYELQQQILAPPGQSDYFGNALASKNQDLLLVGSPNRDLLKNRFGYVNIYEKTNGVWQLTSTLQGPDGLLATSQGYFGMCYGCAVAFVRTDLIAVGSPGDSYFAANGGSDRGTVYLYSRVNGQWPLHTVIASDDTMRHHSHFGDVLSATEGQLIVASQRNNSISIYHFEK